MNPCKDRDASIAEKGWLSDAQGLLGVLGLSVLRHLMGRCPESRGHTAQGTGTAGGMCFRAEAVPGWAGEGTKPSAGTCKGSAARTLSSPIHPGIHFHPFHSITLPFIGN